MVWLAVTLVLLLGYGLLIRYYHGHFKKLPLFSAGNYSPKTFISVLVSARNEAATLPHLLHALAAQTYPQNRFEIIIVDDYSTDDTMAVVQTFSKPHIRIIQPDVDAARSSKKRAIETGVKEAKGPLLLITDADCIPAPDWIKTMAAFYEQKDAVFIAAPVAFTHNGSLLHIFQALDFLALQGITAASVGAQFHSMCNGANLAYTKSAFEAVAGFAGIDHIASGDDMLLMHKIWQRKKNGVQYVKSRDAIVATAPVQSWRAFVAQRKRWASKTTHYNDTRVFAVLLFVYFINCWAFVLLIATFWNAHAGKAALLFLILKTAIEYPFVMTAATFYNQQRLMRYFPFLQPLHIFYTVLIGIVSQAGTYEWKGRRTK